MSEIQKQVDGIVGVYATGILSADAAAAAICGTVKVVESIPDLLMSACSSAKLTGDQSTQLATACQRLMQREASNKSAFVATIVPAKDKYPVMIGIKGGNYNYKPKNLSPRLLSVILDNADELRPIVDKALNS